jgi:hypothetical protein
MYIMLQAESYPNVTSDCSAFPRGNLPIPHSHKLFHNPDNAQCLSSTMLNAQTRTSCLSVARALVLFSNVVHISNYDTTITTPAAAPAGTSEPAASAPPVS